MVKITLIENYLKINRTSNKRTVSNSPAPEKTGNSYPIRIEAYRNLNRKHIETESITEVDEAKKTDQLLKKDILNDPYSSKNVHPSMDEDNVSHLLK